MPADSANPRKSRRFRTVLRGFLGVATIHAFFSGFFVAGAAQPAADTDPAAFSRLYFGLQPPIDREAERRLELVEELFQAGHYGEAAPLVAELLAGEIDNVGGDGRSLKRRLLETLSNAKSSDLAVLRSVLEGQHRRAVAEAQGADALRRVVAAYPPELFGTAALEALARAEIDAGANASAAAVLRFAKQVAARAGDEQSAKRFAAQETICRLRLGQTEKIDPEFNDRLDEWVEATAEEASDSAQRHAPQSWLAAGGDARRLAAAPGELPAPWRTWRAEVGVAADEEERGGGSLAIPAGETIAASGVVITHDPSGLVAFSAETGRRLWEVAFPEDPRSWRRESTAAGISTDTRQVFAVTPSPSADIDTESLLRRRFGDTLFGGEATTLPANCLAAYEIASAGKLRWKIDGGDTAASGMPSTRFLGAPAVADGRLYVLAEAEQLVRLLEIDADSGQVLWNQPLVQCQREPAPQAASIAVSPTLGKDLVYCPTGRGAIAAVDPLRRRIEWLSYLAIDEEDARPSPQGGWGVIRDPQQWGDDALGWRHCRVVEHDGRLVVTSPELASLQVFDAATGDLKWRHDLAEGVLLGAVVDDVVLCVEAQSVTAWRVSDGKSLWKANLPEGEQPAGEALLVGDSLLAPLASGSFASLDLQDATQKPAWRVERLDLNPLAAPSQLGNLLYHDGAILSRSATSLESYRQPPALGDAERRAIAALQADRIQQEEIDRVRDALQERPSDRRLAELLAAMLLKPLDHSGEVAAAAGEELPTLVAGRRASAYAAAIRLGVADARGDVRTVLDEARALSASRAATVLLHPEPELDAVASRLAAYRASVAGADRREVAQMAGFEWPVFDSAPRSPPQPEPLGATSWTTQQVVASVESAPASAISRGGRGMRMRQDRNARTRPVSLVGDTATDLHWSYEARGGDWRLVGVNSWGERAFAEPIPGDPWSPGPDATGVGAPGDRIWGDWLALKLESGYFVCHAERGVLWETSAATAIDRATRVPAHDPNETPVAVGPWGVISVSGASLIGRDLTTGRLVWRRDVKGLGSETLRVLSFGDELFVVGASSEGLRLSAWSGQRLGDWRTAPPRTWRGYAVGRLLVEERVEGQRRFRIGPVEDSGPDATQWEATFDLTTRFLMHEGWAVFFDEEHVLTLIDIGQAKQRVQTTLPVNASDPVRSLRLRTRGGYLLIEVDHSNPMVDRARGAAPVGPDPLLTGELHCLDPQTGVSPWGGMVEIEGMAVVDTAANAAPLVVLARRRAADSTDEQAEAQIAAVVLDLASGATVFRHTELPTGDEQEGPAALWTAYERGAQETLLIRAGRSWVTLETTDQPAPPRPRMIARVEDPDASRPNGPDDIGRGVERLFRSFWEGDDD